MKKNLKTLTLEDVLKKFNLDKEGGNIQDIVDKIVGEKRRICIELNNQYHTAEEIRAIMSQLINKKVDDSFRLFPPFYTDFGIGIVLGRNVFINSGCHFQDWGGVEIGDGTLIGQNVVFATCNHDLDPSKQRKHHFAPIKIGRYVWIGANATILHGVTIGDWAVVGAGAVVTRDVPAMRVVAGVPAKVIQVVPGKMGKMGNMIKRKNLEYPIVSSKRFEIGFHILNHWLDLRQQGKKLTSFFCDNLIKNIAIYGMGALGERLYNELKNSEVIVKYAIDRIADQKNRQDLKIYSSEEKTFPEIDAIVVTPVQDYWAIVSFLETKTSAAIVSLEDVVNYCIAGD